MALALAASQRTLVWSSLAASAWEQFKQGPKGRIGILALATFASLC